jgi:FAD/FMN-containing dehydrogenase
MRDIYTEMAKHNRVVVGGFDANVGIGGFITAGGHSPISSAYGLASDHAIEFTVLTPDGVITNANECQNTDLFWAMKGVCFSIRSPFIPSNTK